MPKKQNLQSLPPEKTGDDESDNELEYVAPIKQPKQQVSTTPLEVQPKKKRNISEEHKQALRERLVLAHQRKRELAEERRKEKDAIEAEYNKKKEMKIMMEAERLRRVREKELKKIEIPTPKQPKKKPVVVYYDEDNESEDDQEEQIIIKSKKKPPQQPKQVIQQQQQIQPPVTPVYQPPIQQSQFQIKFM